MFDDASETEYRWFDGTSIRSIAAATDVPDWSGPLDYAELPAPMREGVAQSVYDAGQAVDLDADGRTDTLRVQLSVTPSRVAAGDFKNLGSARQDIKVTITLAARFDIGAGLPAALAVREPQSIAVTLPQVLDAQPLAAWAIEATGVPVGTTGSPVSTTAAVKDSPVLSLAGSELWLSWREWPQLGTPTNTLLAKVQSQGAVSDRIELVHLRPRLVQ